MNFLEQLPRRAGRHRKRIVFPEGDDQRVQEAAHRLKRVGAVEPILLIPGPADDQSPPPAPGWAGELHHPATDPELDRFAGAYLEGLADEELTLEAARAEVSDPLSFAGMMVCSGLAHGVVGGAVFSTSDVIRAALRTIGTAPGTKSVTGAFYMVVPAFRDSGSPEVLTFADSGVIPDPSVEQLVEIAGQAAHMRGLVVGDEPRLAFLSYSTLGSAGGGSVEKMRDAAARFRAANPEVAAEGELQADAALIHEVALRKAPDSQVAGRANILIFPDLDAGNIAYKLVERLAGARAIGPILHGLARPFNDLSRGCSARDIELVAYVTALMAADLAS